MHILVVEDHTDTRVILANLLRRYGYDVATAATVQDALDLLNSVQFDVLLSDIGLPDGDGLALVGEARSLQSLRMTIALTALASPEDEARGRVAGFDHYLTKPLQMPLLRSVLHQAE